MNSAKTYLILLIDHSKAKLFTLIGGSIGRVEEFKNGEVPQNVKANERDFYGRSDKIFRHIEDHLNRHLKMVSKFTNSFAKKDNIYGIIIGGHEALLPKVKKHLPDLLRRKVKGSFITELKGPFNRILSEAKQLIIDIEKKENAPEFI